MPTLLLAPFFQSLVAMCRLTSRSSSRKFPAAKKATMMKIKQEKNTTTDDSRPWTIRDISDKTRLAVIQAAKKEGMTISHWVNRALDNQADKVLRSTTPAEPCAEISMQLLGEIFSLKQRLERVERLSSRDPIHSPAMKKELLSSHP